MYVCMYVSYVYIHTTKCMRIHKNAMICAHNCKKMFDWYTKCMYAIMLMEMVMGGW